MDIVVEILLEILVLKLTTVLKFAFVRKARWMVHH
jgi:hypothetical protein